MPEEYLKRKFAEFNYDRVKLTRYFGVSLEAMGYRLLNLGLIKSRINSAQICKLYISEINLFVFDVFDKTQFVAAQYQTEYVQLLLHKFAVINVIIQVFSGHAFEFVNY